jgi:hypothetical protein
LKRSLTNWLGYIRERLENRTVCVCDLDTGKIIASPFKSAHLVGAFDSRGCSCDYPHSPAGTTPCVGEHNRYLPRQVGLSPRLPRAPCTIESNIMAYATNSACWSLEERRNEDYIISSPEQVLYSSNLKFILPPALPSAMQVFQLWYSYSLVDGPALTVLVATWRPSRTCNMNQSSTFGACAPSSRLAPTIHDLKRKPRHHM